MSCDPPCEEDDYHDKDSDNNLIGPFILHNLHAHAISMGAVYEDAPYSSMALIFTLFSALSMTAVSRPTHPPQGWRLRAG